MKTQIAAGELQQASTCFVIAKKMIPRLDSTPSSYQSIRAVSDQETH
jgi:hypothetical protein